MKYFHSTGREIQIIGFYNGWSGRKTALKHDLLPIGLTECKSNVSLKLIMLNSHFVGERLATMFLPNYVVPFPHYQIPDCIFLVASQLFPKKRK